MDLTFSEKETAFRDELRGWLAENPPPPEPTEGGEDEHYAWRRDWQRTLYDGGWAAPGWPAEYGGRGASLTESAIYFEEIGRARVPLPANVLGLLLGGPTLMVWGTDEQKERFLAADPVGRGDLVPGLLRARRRLRPRRAQDARGQGRRRLGRHRPEGLDQRRAVLEVVHARRPHRRRRRQAQGPDLLPDGHGAGGRPGPAAAPDHRRGGVQRALHRGGADPGRERRRRRRQRLEGRADDADERARRARLRAPGAAAPAARRPVRGRRGSAACSTTRSSPTSSPTCTCARETIRLLAWKGLTDIERYGQPGPEGSLVKWLWSDTNQQLTQLAADIVGPEALTAGTRWSYELLRARGNSIEGGTTEVLKNIVAERVLGLPRLKAVA